MGFGSSPYKPWQKLGSTGLNWGPAEEKAGPCSILPILRRSGTFLGGVSRRSCRAVQQPSQELLEWLLPLSSKEKAPGDGSGGSAV